MAFGKELFTGTKQGQRKDSVELSEEECAFLEQCLKMQLGFVS